MKQDFPLLRLSCRIWTYDHVDRLLSETLTLPGTAYASAGTSSYDSNGALVSDTGRGISSITWNEIDLPGTVTFSDGSSVAYCYAADGTKLRETRTVSGTATVIDWCGDLVLEKTGSGTVLETDDYYPLGGPLPTGTYAALQPQKYQGKDWNATASFNVYDFGARLYDPALGRWLSQDPLAEKYQAHSPYLFCAGNPMRFVDPEGKEWKEENNVISVSFNFSAEGFDDKFIELFRSTLAALFNEIINTASGGTYNGEIYFFSNNPDIIQTVNLIPFKDNKLGGATTFMYSSINPYDQSGQVLPFVEIAKSTIHELFHTVRLDHPFENTQTMDTQLIRTGANSFMSTADTDSNIVNNIMNYSSIIVDGKQADDLRYLTKGQFNFIRNEIHLQSLGYGIDKNFEDYWMSFPGKPVSR